MVKNYLFYAAGSFEVGYGHLYRVFSIYKKYLSNKKSTFLYCNKVQEDFYKSKKLKAVKICEFEFREDFVLIIDTKDKDIRFLHNFIKNSSKSICIDTINDWVRKFDILVIPNFYFDPKNSPDVNFETPIFYGRKYCIIRKQLPNLKHKNTYLITFGASDPNNITRKILQTIYKEVKSSEITVLLGKGMLDQEPILKKDFPNIKILKDLKSTFEIINNSKIIFSTLGTTVQEIEAAQKKAVICFNSLDDPKDFKKIISSTKNKNLWLNGGHHLNLNVNDIKKFIKITKYKVNYTENNNWGESWKEILFNN